MKASGPREERETIITWDEAGSTASMWTASEMVYKRMLKYGWQPSEDGERHARFEFPKDRIKPPRQKSKRGFGNKPVEVYSAPQ